jgi:hypothetical protein
MELMEVHTMKKIILAFLGLLLLTGCQAHIGGSDAEPATQGKRADRSNVPAVRYIEGTIADASRGGITRISFIDREGSRFMSEDPELLKLSFTAITEKYAKGELTGYTPMEAHIDKEELADTYKLICNAAEFEGYKLEEPDMLPDVEAPVRWVAAMYYTADGTLNRLQIYENKCLTSIRTNCEDANEAYEWYSRAIKVNN